MSFNYVQQTMERVLVIDDDVALPHRGRRIRCGAKRHVAIALARRGRDIGDPTRLARNGPLTFGLSGDCNGAGATIGHNVRRLRRRDLALRRRWPCCDRRCARGVARGDAQREQRDNRHECG